MALIRTLTAALLLVLFAGTAEWAQDGAAYAAPAAAQTETAPDRPESRAEAGDVQQAFRRMKRKPGIQWELRTDLPEPRRRSPFWEAVGRFFDSVFGALAPLFKIIFWVGLAALAAVILYAIATAIIGVVQERRGREASDDTVAEYAPSAATARILLDEADALASQGRFAEAIRLILRRSIQDIERAQPDAVRLSLTSREIARSPRLGERTRSIFSQIARMVEHAHFAGRGASQDDYASARSLYSSLVARPVPPISPQAFDGAAPA